MWQEKPRPSGGQTCVVEDGKAFEGRADLEAAAARLIAQMDSSSPTVEGWCSHSAPGDVSWGVWRTMHGSFGNVSGLDARGCAKVESPT